MLTRALISIPLPSRAQLCPMSQLWRALESHCCFGTAISTHTDSPVGTWGELEGQELGVPLPLITAPNLEATKYTGPLLYWALLEKGN